MTDEKQHDAVLRAAGVKKAVDRLLDHAFQWRPGHAAGRTVAQERSLARIDMQKAGDSVHGALNGPGSVAALRAVANRVGVQVIVDANREEPARGRTRSGGRAGR